MGRVPETVPVLPGDEGGSSMLSEAEVLDAKLPTLNRRICSSLEKHVEDAEGTESLRPGDPGAWIVRGGEDGSDPWPMCPVAAEFLLARGLVLETEYDGL
jgi:hypothetical protein